MSLSGRWIQESHVGLEPFLKSMKIGLLKREVAKKAVVKQNITQDGKKFDIEFTNPKGTKKVSFVIGQEFEEKDMMGKAFSCQATFEEGKLTITGAGTDNDRNMKLVRYIKEDKLIMDITVTLKGEQPASCTRIFKKAA